MKTPNKRLLLVLFLLGLAAQGQDAGAHPGQAHARPETSNATMVSQSLYSLGERMGRQDAPNHVNLMVDNKGIPTIKNDWPSALLVIWTASAQDKGHTQEDERIATLVHKASLAAQMMYARKFVAGYAHGRRSYLSGPQTMPTDAGNLRALGTAVALYAQDHSGELPPLRCSSGFRAALLPYVNNYAPYFRDAVTGEPYWANLNLAGKMFAAIADPAHTLLLFQASAPPKGGRYVLYLNGDVRRVGVVQWGQIRAQLGVH